MDSEFKELEIRFLCFPLFALLYGGLERDYHVAHARGIFAVIKIEHFMR